VRRRLRGAAWLRRWPAGGRRPRSGLRWTDARRPCSVRRRLRSAARWRHTRRGAPPGGLARAGRCIVYLPRRDPRPALGAELGFNWPDLAAGRASCHVARCAVLFTHATRSSAHQGPHPSCPSILVSPAHGSKENPRHASLPGVRHPRRSPSTRHVQRRHALTPPRRLCFTPLLSLIGTKL